MYYKIVIFWLSFLLTVSTISWASSEKELIMSIEDNSGTEMFSEIYSKIKSGDLSFDFKDIINKLIGIFTNEVKSIFAVLRYILIVVCLNAFVTNFNSSYLSKGINNSLYLGCYCILVILTARGFSQAGEICTALIVKVIAMLKAGVPVCISLIASIGNITSRMALKPIYLYFLQFISNLCLNFILPIINAFFALSTVGCISNRFSIRNLTELLKKIIKWAMTATVTVFIGSIGVVGIITDKVIFKGEKGVRFVLGNFVPVVGRLLSDTVETVAASAVLIKNSVGIAGIVMIGIICIPPVIKLFAIVISYKICSALIEPICDRRLSDMLSVLSSSVELMLGICVTTGIIFSISVSVLLTVGG